MLTRARIADPLLQVQQRQPPELGKGVEHHFIGAFLRPRRSEVWGLLSPLFIFRLNRLV